MANLQEPQQPTFHRRLGLFDSVMIVVGVMIGSGIFIVSAEMSCQIGSARWLPVAWAVKGSADCKRRALRATRGAGEGTYVGGRI
jgi:hypothetical protein